MGKIRLEPMTSGYDEPPFNCGVDSIQYMIGEAYDLVRMKQAVVYNVLWDSVIIGQIMISLAWIRDNNYSSTTGTNVHACMLIRYIAVDIDYQHKGIGNQLLRFGIQFFTENCENLPIRCIAFEALPARADWYVKHGFKRFDEGMEFSQENPFIIPMYMDFVDLSALDDEMLNP